MKKNFKLYANTASPFPQKTTNKRRQYYISIRQQEMTKIKMIINKMTRQENKVTTEIKKNKIFEQKE